MGHSFRDNKPTTTRAIATYATNEPQYATRSLLSRSRVDWAIEAARRVRAEPFYYIPYSKYTRRGRGQTSAQHTPRLRGKASGQPGTDGRARLAIYLQLLPPEERAPVSPPLVLGADVLPKKGERGHERSVTCVRDGRRGRSRALGRRTDPGREEGLKAVGGRHCGSSVPGGAVLGHLPVLFSRAVSDDQV